MGRIRVMLVEDDANLHGLLAAAIAEQPDLELIASADSLSAGLALARTAMPDVLLADLGLPDGSGIELIRYVARHCPRCDIMVITVFGDEAHVIAALEAGATGYLLKDALTGELPEQIRQLRQGGSPISPMIARRLLTRLTSPPAGQPASRPVEVERLSERERETLQAVAKGFTYAEIAQLLGVAPTTITTYVRRIYQKLQVRSKTEAVYEARQLGLLRD